MNAGGPYLALETSTTVGSVAVGDGPGDAVELTLGVDARHSESLLVPVDFALRSAGVQVSELRGVVVGGGPGSFTGVRVAGATAKGIVHALGIPLYAVSSLMALAAGVGGGERPVVPLLDARGERVYAACYRFPGFDRVEVLSAPAATTLDEVLAELEAGRSLRAVYVGDGAVRHRSRIESAGGVVAPAPWSYPRASFLLWLCARDPASFRVAHAASWEPEYIRAWAPQGTN